MALLYSLGMKMGAVAKAWGFLGMCMMHPIARRGLVALQFKAAILSTLTSARFPSPSRRSYKGPAANVVLKVRKGMFMAAGMKMVS